MMKPSLAELRIIRTIIAERLGLESPCLNQVALLQFPTRNMTGKGYFVEFAPLPEPLRVDNLGTVISTDLATGLPEPQDLAGFTLFINDGFITSFEGYMFGNTAWPTDPLENWVIMTDPAAAKRA
jgi:hypothetical protein